MRPFRRSQRDELGDEGIVNPVEIAWTEPPKCSRFANGTHFMFQFELLIQFIALESVVGCFPLCQHLVMTGEVLVVVLDVVLELLVQGGVFGLMRRLVDACRITSRVEERHQRLAKVDRTELLEELQQNPREMDVWPSYSVCAVMQKVH